MRYKISLAVLMPMNYELEMEATDIVDAFNKGVEEYNSGHAVGEFVDIDDCDPELDFSDDYDLQDGLPSGAYVELIEKKLPVKHE